MKRNPPRPAFISAVLAFFLAAVSAAARAETTPPGLAPAPKRLLLVTVTTGYRHASIPTAEKVLRQLAADSAGAFQIVAHASQPEMAYPKNPDAATRDRFSAAVRESLAPLSPDRLRAARIDGVIFASTTGDLPLPDRAGLLAWIAEGHAFIGLHSATDTLAGHADYCTMIGGVFDSHPWHEEVTLRVEAPGHPAAGDHREPLVLKDEIYQFNNWSRENLTVILSLDPSNADRPAAPGKPAFFARGKRADQDYALAWVRRHGAGRVFYTALGHGDEVWNDTRFQSHLRGGIQWSLDLAPDSNP